MSVLGSLLAILLIGLHTPIGRQAMAHLIAERLSGASATVAIGSLEGSLLREFMLSDVQISDASGVLAQADRIRVHWRPFAVLGGAITIRSVAVNRLDIRRAPGIGEVAAAAAQLARSAARGVELSLSRLSVERLLLPGEEPAIYKGAGKLEASSGQGLFDLRLALERTGVPSDKTSLLLRVDPRTRAAVLDLDAVETRAGWLALIVGRAARPISLEGQGSGTLDNFAGTIALHAGAEGRVEIAGRTERTGARRTFRLTGAAELGQLVDAPLAPIFAGVTQLTAAGAIQPDGRLQLQEGLLRLAAGTLQVRGEAQPATGAADLLVDLEAGANASLAAGFPWLAGWQSLKATGRVAGQLDRLRANLSLSADAPALRPFRAARLTASVDIVPQAAASPTPLWNIDARGLATAVSVDDARLAPQFGEDVSLQLTGSAAPFGSVRVASLQLQSGAASVSYRGTSSSDALDGDFAMRGLHLPALGTLAGRPSAAVTGTLALSGRVNADSEWRRLRVTGLDGQAKDIGTGYPWLDRLLQGDLAIQGGISWDGGTGALSAEKLALTAQNLRVESNGRTDAEGLASRFSILDLSKLDPALGGAADIDMRLAGGVPALAGELTASMAAGTLFGQPVQGLALSAAARPAGGSLSGELQLAAQLAGEPVLALATILPASPGELTLQPIEAMVGPMSAGGALTLGLAGALGGQIDFASPSLSPLGSFLPFALQGRTQGRIQFTSAGQEGRVQAVATGVRIPQLRTAAAQLSVDGAWDGRTAPQGRAVATGVSLFGRSMDRIGVDLRKRETATLISLDARGADVALSARGRLVPLAGEMRVGVETMLLETAGERIALPNPTFLKYVGENLLIDNAMLRSAGGELHIDGSIGKALNLQLAANCVPLSLLRLVRADLAPQSCLSGTAAISGERTAPAARYALTLAGTGSQKLEGKLDGQADSAAVSAQGKLTGPRTDLSLDGTWPLDAGPLDVRAKGRLDLGTLAALGLVAPATNLAGALSGELAASGTRAAPQLNGRLDIAGGAVRAEGLDIRDATLALVGQGKQVDLTRLQFNLAPRGRVSMHGPIVLAPAEDARLDLKIDGEGIDIAPTSAIGGRADASLTLTGPPGAPRIEGLLALREAKMTLGTPESPAMEAALPGVAALRVRVTAPAGVSLQGQGIEAGFTGEIRLEGEPGKVAATGMLELQRGVIQVGRSTLPLDEGYMEFAGPLDPVLTLQAKAGAAEGAVALLLDGPLSRPIMRIAAEPPAPPREALVRLLTALGQGERAKDPAFVAGVLPLLRDRGTAAEP